MGRTAGLEWLGCRDWNQRRKGARSPTGRAVPEHERTAQLPRVSLPGCNSPTCPPACAPKGPQAWAHPLDDPAHSDHNMHTLQAGHAPACLLAYRQIQYNNTP